MSVILLKHGFSLSFNLLIFLLLLYHVIVTFFQESHYIFKEALQKLVNEIGVEIRIAHYPPYCSKYNPIEHRLFPHVTRACQGVVFKSLAIVHELISRTKTTKGLAVTVAVFEKVYQTGRKATDLFMAQMPIVFDDYLPKWNYRALPQVSFETVI